jgi:C4-dicarboxylate-specific signal transduction histidine kinase
MRGRLARVLGGGDLRRGGRRRHRNRELERPLRHECGDIPYLVIFILFASLVTWFSTLRRRVEQQLLQSNDRLGKEVAERTRQAALLEQTAIEIRTLHQDLEARSRELSPFVLRL